MQRLVPGLLAAAVIMAPLGARAADLVVWWEQGYNPEEDVALRETIAAFEQDTGKQVELVFYEQAELPGKLKAALEDHWSGRASAELYTSTVKKAPHPGGLARARIAPPRRIPGQLG